MVTLGIVCSVALLPLALAQDGLQTLDEVPREKVPALTFKMERNANSPRGQEFIRFGVIFGTHEAPATDIVGTKTTAQDGTIYQRVASIDSIGFDTNKLTRSIDTSVVWLKSGRWYVVKGNVEENWARLAEAGLYEFKPSRGEKKTTTNSE
jgi:hypothetical protein